jgi:hypothetical protein
MFIGTDIKILFANVLVDRSWLVSFLFRPRHEANQMAHAMNLGAKCGAKHNEFFDYEFSKKCFFDRVWNSFLEEIFLIFAWIKNRFFPYKYGQTLDINQLNEFTIKLRNRHCDIRCYQNSINAYQHVISKQY